MNYHKDLTCLSNDEDIENHIFEIYVSATSSTNQDLGIISRTETPLRISIKDEEFSIEQSPNLLTSNSISSSTGFVAWKCSPPFLEWLLYHDNQPFNKLFQREDLQVLELGSGTAGLVASCLSKYCKHFVASDQSKLTKLLKRNIINNVPQFDTNTIDKQAQSSTSTSTKSKFKTPIVDVIELDWEDPQYGIEQLNTWGFQADVILACDTIYNEYLIPHFIETLKSVSTMETIILIAIHLRDFEIVESFLKKCVKVFEVWYVDEEYLTKELQNGFAIYHLKLL